MLARVPHLLVWGDNLQSSACWRTTRATADAYAVALRDRGGRADVLDLPARGEAGNTHQLMMDRNSEKVAGLVAEWLRTQAPLP